MKSKANLVVVVVLICLATSCATAKPTAEEPRGTEMTTHTELTPQVLMDRFLSLIRDVENFDELSPLILERYLEVPFTRMQVKTLGSMCSINPLLIQNMPPLTNSTRNFRSIRMSLWNFYRRAVFLLQPFLLAS